MSLNSKKFYSIGIMSGTSIDGMDISLIQSDGKDFIKPLFNKTYNYTKIFRNNIKNLIVSLDVNSLHKLKYSEDFNIFEKKFTVFVCKKIISFLKSYNLSSEKIDIIGFHGQTLYHNSDKKISLQLGLADKISKTFNIPVVSEFRKDDLANGGQGAPLVPVFHQKIFGKKESNLAVVNIGGISNLTFLQGKRKLYSTDVGPGNRLVDDFCLKFFKKKFDKNGRISKQGFIKKELVEKWLDFEIFKRKIPRSYDSTDFKLDNYINAPKYRRHDLLASLVFFSSKLIVNSLNYYNFKPEKLIVCGGGAKNKTLIKILSELFGRRVVISDKLGWKSDFIESQAFGYLAIRKSLKLYSTFPDTTGVNSPTICGKIFLPSS